MCIVIKNILMWMTAVVVGLSATGCDRYDMSVFFASPSVGVDKRFTQSEDYNALHLSDTLITSATDEYSILLGSDFHIEQEAKNLSKFIAIANRNKVAASIITGDITDQKGGIEVAAEVLKRDSIHQPLRTVVGNHDLYFNQWETYKEHFGTSSYYFVVQTPDTADLYICLDSGNGTLGKKQTDRLIDWLNKKRQHYRHCIVATHTNFFDTDFTQTPSGLYPIEETAMLTNLFSRLRVTMVVNGHDHHFEEYEYNGTRYVTIGSAADDNSDAGYIMLTVSDDIKYEHLNFE